MRVPTKRVLVTGVNGFVGPHVVDEFRRDGYQTIGLAREPQPLAGLALDDYVPADLTGPWPAVGAVEAVVHLAGLSAVGPSFDHPQDYLDVNGAMINQLAAWAVVHAPAARVVVVSSGAVYDASGPGPLTEGARLAMSSPYVVSKVLVENLVGYYRRRGLDWIVARPFNHVGPGQGPGFLLPDLHRQLMAMSDAREISVGDLSTRRDYTDVRDVARAYHLLATTGQTDEWIFNVCSGQSRAGKDLLALLVSALEIAGVTTRVDDRRIRPEDPREIVGSADRLHDLTGWSPQISLDHCVRDFVAGLDDSVNRPVSPAR